MTALGKPAPGGSLCQSVPFSFTPYGVISHLSCIRLTRWMYNKHVLAFFTAFYQPMFIISSCFESDWVFSPSTLPLSLTPSRHAWIESRVGSDAPEYQTLFIRYRAVEDLPEAEATTGSRRPKFEAPSGSTDGQSCISMGWR